MAEGEDGAIEHRERGLGLSQLQLEGGVEVGNVVVQGRATLPRRRGGRGRRGRRGGRGGEGEEGEEREEGEEGEMKTHCWLTR